MKNIIFFFLFTQLTLSVVRGQSSIDDLLKARKVKNFIQLRMDPDKKQLFYQIDKSDGIKYDKQLNTPLTVAAKESAQEIVFQIRFINPLKYKITAADTTYLDSAYQNLNSFFQAAVGFLQTIGTASLTTNSANPITKTANPAALGAAPPTTKDKIQALNGPALIEWKYLSSLTNSSKVEPFTCKPGFDVTIVDKLYDLDQAFYTGSITDKTSLVGSIKDALDKLSGQTTAAEFKKELGNFNTFLTSTLKDKMDKASTLLKDFTGVFKSYVWKNSGNGDCDTYLSYSQWAISNYLTNLEAIQGQWKDISTVLTSLNTDMTAFIGQSDLGADNSVVIARVPISTKNVNELDISIKERSMQVSNSAIKVIDGSGAAVSGKIKVRAYRKLVPEFSTGVFYTNVSYPKYGTTADATGKTVVSQAGADKYYYVVAAHLNLILNTSGSGGINPLWQLGFGSGKDLPSFLSGLGIRFKDPQRFVIAGGCMWSWVKELDKLKIGDQVTGTADLTNDLKYQLRAKPSLYLGIQYNFK